MYRQSAHCTNAQQRHDFGEFFSDLASENVENVECLENLNSTPGYIIIKKIYNGKE
jgi:hypothetical protein